MRTKSKYGNKRIVDGDEIFDSIAEHKRFIELRWLQHAGEITDLKRQSSFILAPGVTLNGKPKRSLRYIADFEYIDKSGQRVIEDVKGAITAVFRVKQHLMASVHGLQITEIRA